MFFRCTSLKSAPELPATTLDTYCYSSMFSNCTSLTTAPELPATTLVKGCYSYMFDGCINLNYIKMFASDISAKSCLFFWVNNIAKSGTFIKNHNANWDNDATDTNGNPIIPEGWTVEYV